MKSHRARTTAVAAAAVLLLTLTGCATHNDALATTGKISAVGAENEYANVISQIGGRDVSVSSILSDPNTDPHTFEASASVASELSGAQLVVQNGVGYDSFMTKLESASPNTNRKVIIAQSVLKLPDSTPNPHLWYDPKTMPKVAAAIEHELAQLRPADASYFKANLTKFIAALKPWAAALASFKADHPNAPVAVTEPVADYALQAAGADIRTPFSLQAAIMNDTDPSPQNVSTQDSLFTSHRVKAFLYNRQVTDAITETFLKLAKANHVPVVAVYETMPTGYTYQTWMLAEILALQKAIADGTSTNSL